MSNPKCIPPRLKNDPTKKGKCERIYENLMKIGRQSQATALKGVLEMCEQSVGGLSSYVSEAFWSMCSTSERRSILGAVFDQHPAAIMKKFRPMEAAVVDFYAIWAADSHDRIKFRRFSQKMWIDFMEHSYWYGIVIHKTALIQPFYKSWTSKMEVVNWQMGDAYELPGVPSGVNQQFDRAPQGYYHNDPEEDEGNYQGGRIYY